MNSSKGNSQGEDEEFEEDFTAKKEATSSSKDVKKSDKANAVRSKHSVTEQRRRSKINERFQILRDLIPHGDQKKDTASFLLEVIEYVQLLQEKVLKYEGSYQGWSTEPTKVMPWPKGSTLEQRHSHWRVQSLLGPPLAVKNAPGPGETFSGKLDEKSTSINASAVANPQIPMERDANHDAYKSMDQQSELVDNAAPMPMPFHVRTPTPVWSDGVLAHPQRQASDAQTTDCSIGDNQQEEYAIEGGTISISSAYSHESTCWHEFFVHICILPSTLRKVKKEICDCHFDSTFEVLINWHLMRGISWRKSGICWTARESPLINLSSKRFSLMLPFSKPSSIHLKKVMCCCTGC
ncbi:hypothetical protein Ancab_018666 [Ancistrocladus abbreviatus]